MSSALINLCEVLEAVIVHNLTAHPLFLRLLSKTKDRVGHV